MYSGNLVDCPALRGSLGVEGVSVKLSPLLRECVPVVGDRGRWLLGERKSDDRSSRPVADGTKFDIGSTASNSQIRS